MKAHFSLSNSQFTLGRSTGFTLIEIIISLSILLIISTSIFAISTTLVQTQKLNSAFDNLKNDLNLAKSSSLSQVIRTSSSECDASTQNLRGYSFYFSSNTNYNLMEVCRSNIDGLDRTYGFKTVTLPSGVTANPVPPVFTFLIQPAGGGISAGYGSDGVPASTQTINLTLGGQTRTIYVSSTGLIYENP